MNVVELGLVELPLALARHGDSSSEDRWPLAIALGALLVAIYGAALSTRNYRWQRRRDEERQRSDIDIDLRIRHGLPDRPLVVGEVVHVEHILEVMVRNRGESPEFVHTVELHSQTSAVYVPVPTGATSIEVRPRDHVTFSLELDGRQAFAWDEPFIAQVRLASGEVFESPRAELPTPPCHGQPVTIPDPDELPDDEVVRLRLEDLEDPPPPP